MKTKKKYKDKFDRMIKYKWYIWRIWKWRDVVEPEREGEYNFYNGL